MKKLVTILLTILIVLVLLFAGGAVWFLTSFHIIDGQFYSKKAQYLDLRDRNVSVAHYESLVQQMPDCEILWNVPFQGGSYSSDLTELTVSDLTTDMDMLVWFPKLETLDARNVDDLSALSALQEKYPDLTILAQVLINGREYPFDVQTLELTAITEEELALLPKLTQLKQVTVTEGGDTANLEQLRNYCQNNGIEFRIHLCGEEITEDTTQMTIANVAEEQVRFLMLMPWLEKIHLPEPKAGMDMLQQLMDTLPDVQITWEVTILGVTYSPDATEIDLTDIISRAEGEGPDDKTAYEYGLEKPVMSQREEVQASVVVDEAHPFPDKTEQTAQLIAELEAATAYLPEVKKITLCGAWLDNEAMAQFRENHREDYKVVWTVQCGPLATRTDATLFMPTKYYVMPGSFADWHTENLKYCEDMISMDIGHMTIAELDFLRYMPKLKYLDIALNHITDLTPLAECKNLVFLVMHTLSMELDYSPLLECTALEDLNIGGNPGDISPVFEMKQLKNLWITGCGEANYNRAKAALPNTNIGYFYKTPNDGWRALPNYFKMRDALLMFYMN